MPVAAVSCNSSGFTSRSSVRSCGSAGIFLYDTVTGQVTEIVVFLCLNKKSPLIHCDSYKSTKDDVLSLARRKSSQDIVASLCNDGSPF